MTTLLDNTLTHLETLVSFDTRNRPRATGWLDAARLRADFFSRVREKVARSAG
ncbi:hypothetical protein HG421_09430 [Xanthomonas campestris pv. badrii]|uniref:Uncharacterized protein n=1 Tax=Xanthomonas campestris pv. badrii TaxID=149696 RepID=A0A7Z2VAQ5_XANCA|nr:hypothetical protein [Xanthomonas campestris]QJD67913.1 hypothetical protein HG421_09430 [Xanthomonas campestris pv. badrii]